MRERRSVVEFQEHRLGNGLEVLLCPIAQAPLVHVTLHYRVGSSYESLGHSGFAHLFEHLMFQGSENIAKNEHGRLVDEAGGRWNASTNKDRTNYFQTLPSHFLDLGLWLEAERMRSLKVTPENFENQRRTVIEEKKQSYDNRPYGRAFLRFDEVAYGNWAYAHSVIGEVEDLENAQVEDAVQFHGTHYGPDNAVLALSGDFDADSSLRKIQEFFGGIRNSTSSRPPNLEEPEQTSAKYEELEDRLAALPAVYMGFHMPAIGTRDYYALSLLSMVLAEGTSSRLYRQFVHERNWLTSLNCGPNNYKGPELFRISFLVQSGVQPQKVSEGVVAELERTCVDEITPQELKKARNQLSHRFIANQAKVSSLGETLARFAIYHGEAGAVNSVLDRYDSITPAEIQQAADRTFRPENRTLLVVKPGATT